MEDYEAFPPLAEMQRGFVGLEVLSFSREKVVVQMNYRVVLPTDSFYLAVSDNRVVVLLDDRETVYIEIPVERSFFPTRSFPSKSVTYAPFLAARIAAVMPAAPQTLNVETKYVLEEKDIYRDTVVETTRKLPDKYVSS